MSPVHLHLLLNHVPVIGLFGVTLLLAAALWRRNQDMSKLALVLSIGLALVAGVVYLTGEPAEEAVENLAGISEAALERHEDAALTALIGMIALGVWSVIVLLANRKRQLSGWLAGVSLAFTAVVFGIVGYTANLGGQIRHTEITADAGGAQSEADDDDDDDR